MEATCKEIAQQLQDDMLNNDKDSDNDDSMGLSLDSDDSSTDKDFDLADADDFDEYIDRTFNNNTLLEATDDSLAASSVAERTEFQLTEDERAIVLAAQHVKDSIVQFKLVARYREQAQQSTNKVHSERKPAVSILWARTTC